MSEIMSGKVKNLALGETFWNTAVCYRHLNSGSKADNYTIRSALCGYENAIVFCVKYGLDYESYIE
jgi:hypothetical protein